MSNFGESTYNDKGELVMHVSGFKSLPQCERCTYLGSHNDDYYGLPNSQIPERERDCFAWGYGRAGQPKPQCWTDGQAAEWLGMPLWWWKVRNVLGPAEEWVTWSRFGRWWRFWLVPSMQRIAANLIQIVDEKGAG